MRAWQPSRQVSALFLPPSAVSVATAAATSSAAAATRRQPSRQLSAADAVADLPPARESRRRVTIGGNEFFAEFK
tara:strand:- start:1153 stop:1377 length:225 start_codon:yes stop_codon:yes gene_type:complete